MFAATRHFQSLVLQINGTLADSSNYAPDFRGLGGQRDGEFLIKTCGPGGADMVW